MEKADVRIEHLREKLTSPDGAELLIYSVDMPQIDGMKKFNDFYEKIRAECIEFCKKKLPARCREAGVYSYKLSCKAHAENDRLTVTLKATFSNKTSHRVLSSSTETHKWELDGFRLRIIK